MLEIELLSLFPSYLEGPLKESILKRAIQKGLLHVASFDVRSYSKEPRGKVDDRPFGGGPGMVMMPEAVSCALRHKRRPSSHVVYLSPQGTPLTSKIAKDLAQKEHLLLLAGHYEGIDQRVLDEEVDQEISIGDVVLTNGCLAALVLIDAVARFVPGVLGHQDAASQDSFEGDLLDCPHYTKPLSFHDKEVPAVLRGGNHEAIALWRKEQQIQKTYLIRPDLLAKNIHSGITLFSSDIVSLRKWYKALTKIDDQSDKGGFSLFLDSHQLSFLPADLPSCGLFSFTLQEDTFARLRQRARVELSSDICVDEPNRLVLRDLDGRLLECQTDS